MKFKYGDRFRFVGLEGNPVDDRTLTVQSVSVTGNLTLHIEFDDREEQGLNGLVSIGYAEATLMVAEGVWKRIEDAG